jgi:uncharacterized protein (DUF433 family)
MSLLDRIELDPRVCNGKAVIQGTRIPVSVILDQIANGDSWDDIVKGFPELKRISRRRFSTRVLCSTKAR